MAVTSLVNTLFRKGLQGVYEAAGIKTSKLLEAPRREMLRCRRG